MYIWATQEKHIKEQRTCKFYGNKTLKQPWRTKEDITKRSDIACKTGRLNIKKVYILQILCVIWYNKNTKELLQYDKVIMNSWKNKARTLGKFLKN